jgi:glucosamine 6-phosphate synthetase-like amidotransferase/phosphosugar isomerase protein
VGQENWLYDEYLKEKFMCGIYGMLLLNGATPDSEHKEILKRLMVASQSRGRDATGLSFAKDGGVFTIKHNAAASVFVKMDEVTNAIDDGFNFNKNGKLYSVIGHTRAWTQGRPENNGNNHPIKCGSIIGVHNGVIGNDRSIFDWITQTTCGKTKRQAEVDSEAIFALINHYSVKNKDDFHAAPLNKKLEHKLPVVNAIVSATPKLRGSMACAVQDIENPKAAWLFRTNSPLTVWHYKAEETIVFASTASIIREAVTPSKFSGPIDIPIDGDQGLCFNLETNKHNSFNIGSSGMYNW